MKTLFHDFATTGDGIITALQVMRLMQRKQEPLAVLADCMTEYPHRIVNLPVPEKRPLAELSRLSDTIRKAETDLGANGRVLVRYSGTEMKLRLLVEAREQPMAELWISRLTEAAQADCA